MSDPADEARLDFPYHLEGQIGFILRRAHQRASSIFAAHFQEANLSPVQFAALVKIRDLGRVSQNQLGRLISMDPATIMGVVNRLEDRKLARRMADSADRRRTLVAITSEGLRLVEDCEALGNAVTKETLQNLSPEEQRTLIDLLNRIA
jgi:DNA-binding MarR family transcriptional regulator